MNTTKYLVVVAFTLATSLLDQIETWAADVLWVYQAGYPITGSPALASDGTVYVASGLDLHAVTNSGGVASNKWVFTSAAGTAFATPAVGTDGTVYCAGGDLFAITLQGHQKWRFASVGTGCPGVGEDGSVYIQGSSSLFAVSPQGSLEWQGGAGGSVRFSSAVASPDTTIYIPSPNLRTLYALAPSGAQKWDVPFGAAGVLAGDSPALAGDGTIYVPADDGLYAFSPSGTRVWFNQAVLSPGSSVAVAGDGTVFVQAIRGFYPLGYGLGLYALTPAGQVKWQISTNLSASPALTLGTPAIDAAGTVYCSAATWLFAFCAGGNLAWAFNAGGSPGDTSSYCWTSPTIGPDGTIYATFGSRLYAFAGTNALADSPWPMYRQNPRHTGKVEKPSLQKPRKRSDNNFQFELFGQISNTFNIEASTNLSTWNSLTSFVATTVPMDVFDLEATNYPARFYRARSDAVPAEKRFRK